MDKKIKIKCRINDVVINSDGIINSDIVKFNYNNEDYIFDIKNNILEKNNEYVLNFDKKMCTIDGDISLAIDVLSINKCNNAISIVYKISDEKFYLEFEYEI